MLRDAVNELKTEYGAEGSYLSCKELTNSVRLSEHDVPHCHE
jgi:hypothetical protein